jgi:recombinational DNA repair ATPase RecF
MIKLETAHIEEVRGIRKLDINFQKGTFVISGPNGSGKSGVIDAIEFALTGQIGRLTGRGTKGLSVAEHGPHVDKIKFPDASFVELKVFLPGVGKSATITRKVSSPNKVKIALAGEDIRAALAEITDHPEITLSRREILRFILVEPTKRSEEIQAILKLDEIGETRSALYAAQNRLQIARGNATTQAQSSRTTLQIHLQIAALNNADLLAVINARRKILGLAEIAELTPDTKLDAGLLAAEKSTEFNKKSALRDLTALSDAAKDFPELANKQAGAILADLEKLETDPALFAALQRRSFLEKGLEFVDGPACPLCDTPWEDEQHLREHLKAKLMKSEEARKIQQALLDNGATISQEIIRVTGLLGPVQKLAGAQGDAAFAALLTSWKVSLDTLKAKLVTVDGLTELKARLTGDWLETPTAFSKSLKTLTEDIEIKPDQTATLDAQTFLTTAQLRLGDYREAMRKSNAVEIAWTGAKATYDTYCTVLEHELNALYEEVQQDFSAFYRAINEDDENKFAAKLTPSEGKLDFDATFYERGLFPPGAYHSEGHQDSMGVCLYLALMKRLFGDQFTLALLDDVVMSVDSGHRLEFCKLLKTHFPHTQFIITTHDRLWAAQLRAAGLVTAKTSLAFHSWTIDTGPLVESNQEIWDEITSALEKGKVEAAAAALRRHLEYISHLMADQIGAKVQFRADGNYELGDLLPPVLARMNDLYGKAAAAAQSWGSDKDKEVASAARDSLSAAAGASNVEQWAVNKAVHYNEWANFGKKDFAPVVASFRALLGCFRCQTCDSWIYTTPRVNPESLRCGCNVINFNLKAKSK